jgi:chromosome segregation ATPase
LASQKPKELKDMLSELVRRINEDRRRIRLMEQNIGRLENSLSSIESSVLSQMGDLKISLDRINNKLSLSTERLNLIESDITKLKKQVSVGATKIELKQVESFIDLVNPVTSKFVTKDELDRAFDERLKRKI